MRKLFLLGCLLAGVMCSCRQPDISGNYYDLIPANSRAVCAVNVNQLIEKGEISNQMQTELARALQLENILGNGEEAGIDFSDYVFVVADSIKDNLALVAKVKDVTSLKRMFARLEKENRCTPLATRGEYSETTVSGEMVCCFNSNVLFCTMSYRPEQAREYALRIAARKERSMGNEPCLKKMLERKSDVELLLPMRNLPAGIKENVRLYMAHPDFDLNQLCLNGCLNFEDGKMNLQYMLTSADDAVMRVLQEQGSCIEKVSERFLTYYPASTLLCALYSCKGDKLNELLDKAGSWKRMPLVDVKTVQKVLVSLDGDMSYGITGLSAMGMPNVLVYARVKDVYPADLLADVLKKTLGNVGVVKEKGNHRYEVNSQFMEVYFGVKDGNLFYLTNDGEAYRNLGKAVKNPWNKTVMASGIKEYYGGTVLNIEELLHSPVVLLLLQQTVGRKQVALLQKSLSEFSYTELLTVAPDHVVWNVYMKNNKQNSLKTLIEAGKELSGMK